MGSFLTTVIVQFGGWSLMKFPKLKLHPKITVTIWPPLSILIITPS